MDAIKKVSHTPGPWRTSPTYALVETDTLKICEVHVNENVNENDFSFEQWRANAKLIAAAPELLFQVQQAMQILEVIDPRNPAIDQMESVIKKATE